MRHARGWYVQRGENTEKGNEREDVVVSRSGKASYSYIWVETVGQKDQVSREEHSQQEASCAREKLAKRRQGHRKNEKRKRTVGHSRDGITSVWSWELLALCWVVAPSDSGSQHPSGSGWKRSAGRPVRRWSFPDREGGDLARSGTGGIGKKLSFGHALKVESAQSTWCAGAWVWGRMRRQDNAKDPGMTNQNCH